MPERPLAGRVAVVAGATRGAGRHGDSRPDRPRRRGAGHRTVRTGRPHGRWQRQQPGVDAGYGFTDATESFERHGLAVLTIFAQDAFYADLHEIGAGLEPTTLDEPVSRHFDMG